MVKNQWGLGQGGIASRDLKREETQLGIINKKSNKSHGTGSPFESMYIKCKVGGKPQIRTPGNTTMGEGGGRGGKEEPG